MLNFFSIDIFLQNLWDCLSPLIFLLVAFFIEQDKYNRKGYIQNLPKCENKDGIYTISKNLVIDVSEKKKYNTCPFNFGFRQIFYITFLIVINRYNIIRELHSSYRASFSRGTKNCDTLLVYITSFREKLYWISVWNFFVCLDEFHLLVDYKPACSFHFLFQKWHACVTIRVKRFHLSSLFGL